MNTFIKLALFASALALPVRALCSSAWVARTLVGTQDSVQIDDGVFAARDLPLGERRRALAVLHAGAAAEVLALHPPHTLYASLARLTRGAHFDDVFGPGPANPH